MGGKSTFTDDEKEIWNRCWGQKQLGLSNPETWNAVDLIGKHLGLYPRILELGVEREPFEKPRFVDAEKHLRTHRDGFLGALYLAADFTHATGCRAGNLDDWAYALGRGDWAPTLVPVTRTDAAEHPFAPNFDPGPDILADLAEEKLLGRNKKTRFFSTEFIVFFLLAYTEWDDDAVWHNLNVFWDKFGTKTLNVTALAIQKIRPSPTPTKQLLLVPATTPADDDIDEIIKVVESGIVSGDGPPKTQTRRSFPKAADDLIAYKPKVFDREVFKVFDEMVNPPLSEEEELQRLTREIAAARDAERELSNRRDQLLARIEAAARESAERKAAAAGQGFDHEGSTLHSDIVGAYETLHSTLSDGTRVFYTFGGVIPAATVASGQ